MLGANFRMSSLEGKIALILGASREGIHGPSHRVPLCRRGGGGRRSGPEREAASKFGHLDPGFGNSVKHRKQGRCRRTWDAGGRKLSGIDIGVKQLPPDRSARSKRRPTITLDEMLSIIFKGSFSSVRAMVTALKRDRNDARASVRSSTSRLPWPISCSSSAPPTWARRQA